MNLQCHEEMPNEITLKKRKIKNLYKLAREELFNKNYFCVYCGMLDLDKEWMQIHIKNFHDECSKIISIFQCKMCKHTLMGNKIIKHIIQRHI